MADMALGLTKKAVEGTVSRVLAAIDEDMKLKAAAQEHLRFIVGEFQMMQSFLEMANDSKKQTSSKVAKTWVRQLRELAFDVEDCVEFVVHLDTSSHRYPWVWRVLPLPSSMKPAWVGELDQAVAQLKQLKARVEELSHRNTRYNLLGRDDSGSSSTPPPVPPEQLDAAAFPSTVDILRDLWKANAKQSSSLKCNLKYLVADGRCKELRVITVWRSPGVDLEAAHILNEAYLDPEICKEFKARARVKLMHPFNIQELIKSLLNQLFVTSHQQDTLGADQLSPAGHTNVVHDELRQLLSKHKYLVILEDISSAVEWDLIRLCLPDHKNGSRIVISTEKLGIALSCTGEPYRVLQLALLPNNDRYIYAFYKSLSIAQLVWQLRQRRVISLWGDEGGDTASLVKDVCEAMVNNTADGYETFEMIVFPSPFSCEDFCQSLPSRVAVCESRCLVVIEDLQSKEEWDLIKDAGLVPEDNKSCIVIIAKEEAVAKYCEDNSWRKMDDKENEEANNAAIIGPLLTQKEDQYYSWGHDDRFGSHGCSRRIDEALFQFEPFITREQEDFLCDMLHAYISSYGVHAVWGPTGVGKSALVRFAYYTLMAYSLKMIEKTKLPKSKVLFAWSDDLTSFEKFGWVDVPDEPFDLTEFSRRLLLDFNSYHPGELEKTAVGILQGNNPIQQCYEIMRKHKCLVVIDGLQSTRDWESIKQAFWRDHHQESCIFVITIDESIAQHCVNNKDGNSDQRTTIPMRGLDDKSALDLFKKFANKDKSNETETEQKLKHANRTVPKCGGLPKIIDAVAKSDLSFFENINDYLVTKLKNGPQFGDLRGVFSWMHSYFDGCSDSVKPCIFYLSVFPTNYKIRKAHLLRRWIAEGYSRDSTTGCSAKKNAESLFDELVKLGIIQELPGMPSCQINGFFREYIISQPMEDNLVFGMEGNSKPNSQRTVQHLTVMEDWEREKHVFESIDVSRLRSLTVYGTWQKFFISDNKMKRIRVLDLEGTSGLKDVDLKLIFGILLTLKFISLRGCKSINCLPKTLGGLRQLESLDVRGTSIVTLPRTILKLQKMQNIQAGTLSPFEEWTSAASEDHSDDADGTQPSGATPTPPEATSPPQAITSQDKEADGAKQKIYPPEVEGSDGGVEVPEGIENMPALHTLGTVNIKSARGKDFLKKLKEKKKLRQLLKLSVCGINRENWKDLCDAFSAHDHLESLSLGFDKDYNMEDGCFDNPLKAVKSLRLYGHIHRMAACTLIKDPRLEASLKKFDLEMIILNQGDMGELAECLSWRYPLRRLFIKPTPQVSRLEFKSYKRSVMPQVLKIDCSSALEVAFQKGSIADFVKLLIIHCSKGSDFRISSNEEGGLKHLYYLETVWLKGYDEKADYMAHLKKQIAAHERKPVFKFEKLN